MLDAALHALLLSQTYQTPWILSHQKMQAGAGNSDASIYDDDGDEEEDVEIDDINFEMIDDTGDMLCCEVTALTLEETTGQKELDDVAQLCENLMSTKIGVTELEENTGLRSVLDKIEEHKSNATEQSRTEKLWLGYLKMIEILKLSIRAERTGDFLLHLQSIRLMLPYFAASGHHLYLKSAWLYLQQMLQLKNSNPDLHKAFVTGHHVMRRSDRKWAGLSSDLMIEQVLMRSLKTSGGLTRGKGFGECQRILWLLALPVCGEISASMGKLQCLRRHDIDKHKESTLTRQIRDHNHTRRFVQYMDCRNPFDTERSSLVSIVSGKEAHSSVNVDNAREIGEGILSRMTTKSVSEVVFKNHEKVVTMTASTDVALPKTLQIDPMLLFQRLMAVQNNQPGDVESAFQYELNSVPASLFDSSGLMNSAIKSQLSDVLWEPEMRPDRTNPNVHHVIDGGSLLHRFKWHQNASYGEISEMYVQYVQSRYPGSTIVFDGYKNTTSTKDTAHIKRCTLMSPDVEVTSLHVCDVSRESFLANSKNKQCFIHLLGKDLTEHGMSVCHAPGDADTRIVSEALGSAKHQNTIVIGEDTDLLVLLLYHFDENLKDLHFQSFKNKSIKIWDIKMAHTIIGQDLCQNILVLHAFSGCDTTSRPFSVGKSHIINKFRKDALFRRAVSTFSQATDKVQVEEAGQRIMTSLYGGNHQESLDGLRYRKYLQKLRSQTKPIHPSSLPPSSASCQYHSYRVFLQIEIWRQLIDEFEINPLDWGWELTDETLFPIYMNKPPAPQELLSLISCKCKTGCGSSLCSCRKHGLNCTKACLLCLGEYCSNVPHLVCDSSSDEDDV